MKRELDIHVNATCRDEDSIDYAIEIDFEGILCEESPKQSTVIKDLLELEIATRYNSKNAITSLLKHPLVATYIALKWKKTKWYFYTTSVLFILFLTLYSSIVTYFFNRPELYCRYTIQTLCNETQLENQKDWYWVDFQYFEVVKGLYLTLFVLLILIEIYQASKLKMQYFKELENYIEWFVLISALITMIFNETILQKNETAACVRGVTALGICSAWLQLIFIIGRYPFSFGDFSIMFYNIIKKIARYLIIMIIMIIGFAFAFMFVNYRHDQESFQNPIKRLMMTFTMALGEFELVDIYNAFGEDSISRGFAMVLLVLLILFGTITMVNLFIAVIISDITQLHADVYTRNLINMVHCSILVEELLPTCILRRMKLEAKVRICVHNICTKECPGILLPDSLNPVLEELRNIARNPTGQAEDHL